MKKEEILEEEEKVQKDFKRKAVKNSFYNFATGILAKLFSLIFIIFLARLLQPELFGDYNIVISLTLIFLTFADLGVNNALIRYVSCSLNKKEKAKQYFSYLLRLKFLLTFGICIFIVILAKPMALFLFKKPQLFFPIILASIYAFVIAFVDFFSSLFESFSEFKYRLGKEIIWQVTRLVFTIILLFFVAKTVSNALNALILCSTITFIFVFFFTKKRYNEIFKSSKFKILQSEKKRLNRYVIFVGIASIAFTIFVYIDTVMIGMFLPSEYAGYYRAAYSLVMACFGLIAFYAAFFPLLSRISLDKLKDFFEKALRISCVFSFPVALGLPIIAKPFIKLIYGEAYLPAVIPLYVLSLFIITASFYFYVILFNARQKPEVPTKFVIIAMIINIILNYIFIKSFLKFGAIYSTAGAAIATILSNIFFYWVLAVQAKKHFEITPRKGIFFKPLFAAAIMVIFMLLLNKFFKLDRIWYLALIEVVLAAGVYLIMMLLIKGVRKNDFNLVQTLLKK